MTKEEPPLGEKKPVYPIQVPSLRDGRFTSFDLLLFLEVVVMPWTGRDLCRLVLWAGRTIGPHYLELSRIKWPRWSPLNRRLRACRGGNSLIWVHTTGRW